MAHNNKNRMTVSKNDDKADRRSSEGYFRTDQRWLLVYIIMINAKASDINLS